MSADNWGTCPRCLKRAEKAQEAKKNRAVKAYGKVSPDEYAKLLLLASEEDAMESTLREDYDIGITEEGSGVFYVRYTARCTACELSFTFNHEEKLPQ